VAYGKRNESELCGDDHHFALQITILETERTLFAIKDVVSQVPLPSGMILSVQTPAELQSALVIGLVPDLILTTPTAWQP
jgi:hypothetical protein